MDLDLLRGARAGCEEIHRAVGEETHDDAEYPAEQGAEEGPADAAGSLIVHDLLLIR
jgi:hypothetical protein